jgi:carotenoid cleavage dioxygenase-like enzyme
MGNSGLLKVEFHDGKAYAKYKMVETPAYKRDLQARNFDRPSPVYGQLKSYIGIKYDPALNNSANTSVLRLPNSDKFYTLYEGGMPYEMSEK